jgi:hypothetical protein
MKNYQKAIASLVLAFTFTSSANADDGIIQTGSPAPQPSPTANGAMPTEGIMDTDKADALTQIGLDVLQGLLTRF